MERNKYLMPASIIHSFFIIGLLSSLSIRLIILFKHLQPDFIRPAWYCGVIGYVFFFAYRYYITLKRKRLIINNGLISKIGSLQELASNDRELLEYVVTSIVKSREHINYMFIFASSIVAIIIDLILAHIGAS